MTDIPDIDLDVRDRDAALAVFPEAIRASQIDNKGNLVPHKTGVYFQDVPRDFQTGLAAFPYDIAEELGFFKVDMIPYHIYDSLESNDDLEGLLAVIDRGEFPWEWFSEDRFFENDDTSEPVTQLGRHQHLCEMYPPESVEDVAVLNALIRPRKKYLVGRPWEEIQDKVWKKLPEEESDDPRNYFFKKSHAVAFALAILIHMQILDQIQIGQKPESSFYD